MLREARALTAGLLVAALVPWLVVMDAAPAQAAPQHCRSLDCPDEASGSAEGGVISVEVRGRFVSGGGQSVPVPAASVRVPPVCWYGFVATGAEYFDWWESGRFDGLMPRLPEEDRFEPYPGYTAHAEDDQGGWWSPRCSSAAWEGDLSGFFEYTSRYFAENSATYVPAGQVPPQADVPPEVLAQIAFDAMELPQGRVRWNPERSGDSATFVGMDTWAWVEDAALHAEVTASVSTGTWARVDAGLTELVVQADGARDARCPGAGVAWSEGADAGGACVVVFDRSSANQPVRAGATVPSATMTATAHWEASWVSSLDPVPTPLPAQEVSTTAQVPVAEIQALVTR